MQSINVLSLQWSHDSNDGPRTTNCVEGWHSKLNKRIRSHPSLFSLISTLQLLQEETESDLRQIDRGETVRPRVTKFQVLDAEIRLLRTRYDASHVTQSEFLRDAGSLLGKQKPEAVLRQ